VMRLQSSAVMAPDSANMSMLSGRGGPASKLPQMSEPALGAMGSRTEPKANSAAAATAANAANATNDRNSLPAWPAPAPAPAFSAPETWLPTLDSVVEPKASPAPARKVLDSPESAVERTDPTLQSLKGARLALRDVSIEELIDLEQQADFFVALDQDDAAVNLLNDHLRQTGGASPLPYLKLLEIYRRRGDRNDYERCRVRFNQRFNAYAPDWEVGLQSGRDLASYPDITPRLQQVWRRPLDSMAELEALLFRRSRGELFDLPAYREVLFLYAVARDLLDHETTDTGRVDVLLPLVGVGAGVGSGVGAGADAAGRLTTSSPGFSATAPLHLHDAGPASEFDAATVQQMTDMPTAPVDFDLTADPTQAASIFDPLKPSLALRRP
jgi:pilus assembly protein FimV